MVAAAEAASRDYIDSLADSTRWRAFLPRAGDIVVNTPPKAGTTWTQGILALLISGDPEVEAQPAIKAPWIDINRRDIAEVVERLEAQQHRRQVKSHTPFDGIPTWAELRYIAVYRHPIDIHFSSRKHMANMKEMPRPELFPDDPSESFRIFLEGEHREGVSLSAIVAHYCSTLARQQRENFLVLHYADMKRDLGDVFARIAAHVGISHPPEVMARLVEAATFDNMKANAVRFAPGAGVDFWRSDAGFFDSASSNKWVGQLSEADLAAYDARISGLLPPKERNWLEWGDGAA